MKTPTNKLILGVVATVVVVAVLAIGLSMAFGSKPDDSVEPPRARESVEETEEQAESEEDLRQGSDGGIEFSFDINEVRQGVSEISDGSPVSRMPSQGNQFVTVRVKAHNTTDSQKSLYVTDQYLIMKSGDKVTADAGLQNYIADGDWYEFIPAKQSVSGIWVFEIGADDQIDAIEFHGGSGTAGALVKFYEEIDSQPGAETKQQGDATVESKPES